MSQPEFASNWRGRRVADAVSAYLGHLRQTVGQDYQLDVATAYFNLGGYELLADELDTPHRVRVLLGAEPPEPERRLRSLAEPAVHSRAERMRLQRALADQHGALAADRDLLGFTFEADAQAARLIEWLGSDGVEVRRLEDQFLHGKAFLVQHPWKGVIAGSSNFTHAGLANNLELNLGVYSPSTVDEVAAWFEDLWQQATPFDLAGLYAQRFEPFSPWLVYLRMLYERYGDELAAEANEAGFARIQLTSFQRDGLWRARRILAERRGVLIADEVGLGKTFIAGELLREAAQERRQRAVVIAPATLRDGPWRRFVLQHGLPVEVISFDDLVAGKLEFELNQYALVVIDEAHALRNPSTDRAEAMRQLLAGRPPKNVALLTATPVNNSLWDLYNLLAYFLPNDAAFADAGIPSLRRHFARAMAEDPDDLTPEHLFDVLDAVAVRRTRSFVKTYYPNDTLPLPDGTRFAITFPTPRACKVAYDLTDAFGGFFDEFAAALPGPDDRDSDDVTADTALTLARYAPSAYRLDGAQSPYERQLTGLLRSGLLKRFESSAYAFAETCRTMAAGHEAFLSLLKQGKIATGETLSEWLTTDSDDVDQFLKAYQAELEHADQFDVPALRADVEADRALLERFAERAERVTAASDPKLKVLADELATITAEAREQAVSDVDASDKRKVLVFTYFTDTADWIHRHLHRLIETDKRLADYRGRIARVTGRSSDQAKHALWGFAPRTTDAPAAYDADRYDVLVATDVLAEGVNLQQARHIINYDLPWNPMRLVQRHGRIDRIGSPHRDVYLRCIFPDAQLDNLLGLEHRLHFKIKQAAAAVGVAEGVLPDTEARTDVVFAETHEEIQALRAELDRLSQGDPSLFEEAGQAEGQMSGEEYRKALQQALEDPDLAERIRELPWGAGSGFHRPGAIPGFVFCVQVADHPQPVFRYVRVPDHGPPEVLRDTLSCLAQAYPTEGSETPRELSEHEREQAYQAWGIAHDDVFKRWTEATDPANLTPAVPKPLREAAALLRRTPPAGMEQADVDRLIEAVEAPHGLRTQRKVRALFARGLSRAETAAAIAQLVQELGLQPAPAPEPLPPITVEDIHLIAWLAISPS
jgi:superfamily II DNA or RNA helicase